MDTPNLILRNGRVYRQSVQEMDLGDQNLILEGLIAPSPITIPRIFFIQSEPVHGVFAETAVTLFCRLNSLPMHVRMYLRDEFTRLAPFSTNDFGEALPTKDNAHVIVKDPWTPPTGFTLYFAVKFTKGTKDTAVPSLGSCYLLLRTPENRWLAPYYPNVYDEGRICMGHTWENERGNTGKNRSLFDAFSHCYTSFHSTRMNNHLTNDNHVMLYQMKVDTVTGKNQWIYPAKSNHYGVETSLAFLRHMMPF